MFESSDDCTNSAMGLKSQARIAGPEGKEVPPHQACKGSDFDVGRRIKSGEKFSRHRVTNRRFG